MWQYFTEIAQLRRPNSGGRWRGTPTTGVFLVARDEDGDLLGCAGVRLLPDLPGTAELKRMFVRPAGRGTGLGRACSWPRRPRRTPTRGRFES
ncbi:GNAT family N-acetyltransferase [Nonomuraea sp. NPDC059022]